MLETLLISKTTVVLNKVQECANICFKSSYIGLSNVKLLKKLFYKSVSLYNMDAT